MVKLSNKLNDLGFFSAFGTCEGPSWREKEESYIRRGNPNTFDSNNGVTVVNDEQGRPWIIRNEEIKESIETLVSEYKLQRGAYVPHSNDGGEFILKTLPAL